MSKRPFASVLAVLLTIIIVAPSAFFVAPQRAHAQWAVAVVGDIVGWVQQTISAIEETVSAASAIANDVNTFVLQPLAFVLSGNLMKMLTASVVQFVIGKANGTGVPQFVVDVKRSMQTVGDSQALAYLRQVGLTNSPFAGSISSALRNDYLTKTSLRGFWDANLCSLTQSSPDVPAYLAGNWQKGGGIAAWFSLTTQTQNDPYSLFQHTQTQLAAVVGSGVGGATDVRAADIARGGGFMSWCGSSDTIKSVTCVGNQVYDEDTGTCVQSVFVDGVVPDSPKGVNPGDSCTNSDGTPGTIKTPGSVIKATLDKVLGGQQDNIVRMGNIGPQITSILSGVGNIINTVNFASSLLGGGKSGGLFGVDETSASSPTSRLAEFAPTQDSSGNFTSGYGGATQVGVFQDAASKGFSGGDKLNLLSKYEAAWYTIGASADTASTALGSLASFCTTAADKAALAMTVDEFGNQITQTTDLSTIHSTFIDAARAQAVEATSAITTMIAPVLAKAKAASVVSTNVREMVDKVQGELNAPTASGSSTYAADLQTLQNMPPSATDFANAQKDAQDFGATANPEGSLNVSGDSLVAKMNLLSTNAEVLKVSVCTPGGGVVTGG